MDYKDYLERSKIAWKRAGDFTLLKSDVYPEHRNIQEFYMHTGLDILEYGCGPGADAFEYLKCKNRVTLCDIVAENLDKAHSNLKLQGLADNATFQHLQDSYPLPFETASFDLVNSHGVLHHVVNAPDVVQEMYRVLKPGGLIYVMLYTEYLYRNAQGFIPSVKEQYQLSDEEAFGWFTDGSGTPYSIYYTEATGEQLLEQAGFTILYHTLYNNDQFRTFKGIKMR